jgi:hypothetical protein
VHFMWSVCSSQPGESVKQLKVTPNTSQTKMMCVEILVVALSYFPSTCIESELERESSEKKLAKISDLELG